MTKLPKTRPLPRSFTAVVLGAGLSTAAHYIDMPVFTFVGVTLLLAGLWLFWGGE